jgi:transposase InsO family protein
MLGKGCATGARVHQGLGYDFLHVAIDDCSRVAYVEALADERGDTSAAFAGRALGFYRQLGIRVAQVMTDNGAGYRSGAFHQVLAQAGVGHLRTRPYRPQANGKVERLNRTINWNGPTPGSIPATRPGWTPSLAGSTTRTTIVPTPPWKAAAPCKPSTTSPGTTPRRRGRP